FDAMISIEDCGDPVVRRRFEFNIPLGNIDLHFGHTNTELPALRWDLRTIAWMDYDGPLNSSVLTDISYISSKLISGSALAVSVNADLYDQDEGTKSSINVLTDRLGSKTKLPDWVA